MPVRYSCPGCLITATREQMLHAKMVDGRLMTACESCHMALIIDEEPKCQGKRKCAAKPTRVVAGWSPMSSSPSGSVSWRSYCDEHYASRSWFRRMQDDMNYPVKDGVIPSERRQA